MSDERVRAVVVGVLGRTRVPQAGDFSLRDAGLDSIGMIELLGALESTFGVRIGPEDVTPHHFATLGSLTALVDARAGSR